MIEFFGLPGAGKTSIAAPAGRTYNLRTRGDLRAEWSRRSLLRKCKYLLGTLSEPRCGRAAWDLTLKARLITPDSLRRIALIVAKYRWIKAQDGSLLLDEGFLQSLWSALYSSAAFDVPSSTLQPIISCLYESAATHIIFLDVPASVAAARVSDRRHGRSRFDLLQVDEIERRLAKSGGIAQALVAAASASGLHVHRLDGTAPEPELCARAAELIGAIVNSTVQEEGEC